MPRGRRYLAMGLVRVKTNREGWLGDNTDCAMIKARYFIYSPMTRRPR